ncbi:MAG: hypothetical protein AAB423_03200 [Patescibacteria group bacterium]
MVITYALKPQNILLFEKQTELYQKYSEGSIAKERLFLSQESFQYNWLGQLAGKDGA